MDRNSTIALLDSLYQDTDGFSLAYQEKLNRPHNSLSLTYGEIDFETFAQILTLADVKPGETFYDLGCGVGKPVFAASLLEPFGKCVGVELLSSLYNKSCLIKDAFDHAIRPKLKHPVADIDFIHKDMFEVDWSEADVFYTASTCFDDEMMEKIAKKTETTKKGARFIVLTKALVHNDLFLLYHGVKKMSWGNTAVGVYKKIH